MKTEIKYGVIFAIAWIIWLSLEFAVGLHDKWIAYHPIVTPFFTLVYIALIVLAMRNRKKERNGEMSWMEGFKSGMLLVGVASILSVPMQYSFHAFINPDYFEHAITLSVEKGVDEAQARSTFNVTSYLIQTFVGNLFVGAIIVVITAAVMKRKKG